jgi:hypothetical protein
MQSFVIFSTVFDCQKILILELLLILVGSLCYGSFMIKTFKQSGRGRVDETETDPPLGASGWTSNITVQMPFI